jgi:Mg-chelatase subunit ChlD
VLVIDRSGSMLAPAGAPKLDAAKNAATLFVDAAGSDDQIGVVTFGGDNVEPNDDATLARILQPATDGQRNLCKGAIGGISTTPNVLTSIGDGLAKGAQEFPVRGSVLGEDWLVLLSDGMQNEAQFWSTIRPAIQAAGIKVNAIALGPLTDQALLQSIADDTGGIYYYVDVGTAASLSAAPSAAPAASAGALPNRLSDAYSLATERIQRLDRLWEIAGTSGGPESFVIPVSEGGIEDARFA